MVGPTALRYGLAAVLLAHGVGHTVGFWGESRESWLLSGVFPGAVTWTVEVAWMLLTAALFVAAGLGLVGAVPRELWRPLAAVAAGLSLAGIVAFWGTWPGGTMVYALAFDVAVLVALYWFGWPSERALGW